MNFFYLLRVKLLWYGEPSPGDRTVKVDDHSVLVNSLKSIDSYTMTWSSKTEMEDFLSTGKLRTSA